MHVTEYLDHTLGTFRNTGEVSWRRHLWNIYHAEEATVKNVARDDNDALNKTYFSSLKVPHLHRSTLRFNERALSFRFIGLFASVPTYKDAGETKAF